MQKGLVALICMIIGLVFIFISFFGPWYHINIDFTLSGENGYSNHAYDLTKRTAETVGDSDPRGDRIETTDYEADWPTTNIFNITMYLLLGAVITAIIALIGILGTIVHFGKEVLMRKLGFILGIITFILAIVAVIYFMIALPGETESGSAGTQPDEGYPGRRWANIA